MGAKRQLGVLRCFEMKKSDGVDLNNSSAAWQVAGAAQGIYLLLREEVQGEGGDDALSPSKMDWGGDTCIHEHAIHVHMHTCVLAKHCTAHEGTVQRSATRASSKWTDSEMDGRT